MKIESDSLAVASKVVKTFAMNVLRVRGDKLGANNRFLQLHDAKALPANGVVPLRTYPIYATAPFDFNSEQVPILFQNGCVVAVSTTENTLTLDTDTINLFLTGESSTDDTGWDTDGDYTTGTASTDIAITATCPQLKRIEFTALSDAGAVLYAKVFANDSASLVVGQRPQIEIPLARNTSKDSWSDTILMQTLANVIYTKGSIIIDSTPGPLVGSYAGADFAIKVSFVELA